MINCVVPLRSFFTNANLEIIELVVKDRIKSVMEGRPFDNLIIPYANLYLTAPDWYYDHGLQEDWFRDVGYELYTVFDYIESDPGYIAALSILNTHAGKPYWLSSFNSNFIVVFIQG